MFVITFHIFSYFRVQLLLFLLFLFLKQQAAQLKKTKQDESIRNAIIQYGYCLSSWKRQGLKQLLFLPIFHFSCLRIFTHAWVCTSLQIPLSILLYFLTPYQTRTLCCLDHYFWNTSCKFISLLLLFENLQSFPVIHVFAIMWLWDLGVTSWRVEPDKWRRIWCT